MYVIEQCLTTALDPKMDITPGQFRDLMEMFITDMHLRKVMGKAWMEWLPMCIDGIRASASIEAEFALLKVEGLTDVQKKTLEGARDLSITQINNLRRKLYEKLTLLKQCPNEGDKIY